MVVSGFCRAKRLCGEMEELREVEVSNAKHSHNLCVCYSHKGLTAETAWGGTTSN